MPSYVIFLSYRRVPLSVSPTHHRCLFFLFFIRFYGVAAAYPVREKGVGVMSWTPVPCAFVPLCHTCDDGIAPADVHINPLPAPHPTTVQLYLWQSNACEAVRFVSLSFLFLWTSFHFAVAVTFALPLAGVCPHDGERATAAPCGYIMTVRKRTNN